MLLSTGKEKEETQYTKKSKEEFGNVVRGSHTFTSTPINFGG
jgi:hypothetical protein